MPKRPPRTVDQRIDALEAQLTELLARVAQLGAQDAELDSLKTDIKGIRAELARRGVGPIENPARRGPKLSADEVSAVRRRNAAIARAAKEVGRGQDRVRSTVTKQRLETQAYGERPKRAPAAKTRKPR